VPDKPADMVCINETRRRLEFVERAQLLGISLPRAIFLAQCSHVPRAKERGLPACSIPYDPDVQLAEAARLGLSARDTAEMMDLPYDVVVASGHPFPARSSVRRPPGQSSFCLFQPEPHYKKTIYGKDY
jgi:hypothetical protein